jgi:hypothetical protein
VGLDSAVDSFEGAQAECADTYVPGHALATSDQLWPTTDRGSEISSMTLSTIREPAPGAP